MDKVSIFYLEVEERIWSEKEYEIRNTDLKNNPRSTLLPPGQGKAGLFGVALHCVPPQRVFTLLCGCHQCNYVLLGTGLLGAALGCAAS